MIHDKILANRKNLYFIRSLYVKKKHYEGFKEKRIEAGIEVEEITPADFTPNNQQWSKERKVTFIPSNEYNSPIGIDIFGDNVAFINYKNGMSTLIESPEIADAMRQFFLFSRKFIKKATDQKALDNEIRDRIKSAKQNEASKR